MNDNSAGNAPSLDFSKLLGFRGVHLGERTPARLVDVLADIHNKVGEIVPATIVRNAEPTGSILKRD